MSNEKWPPAGMKIRRGKSPAQIEKERLQKAVQAAKEEARQPGKNVIGRAVQTGWEEWRNS